LTATGQSPQSPWISMGEGGVWQRGDEWVSGSWQKSLMEGGIADTNGQMLELWRMARFRASLRLSIAQLRPGQHCPAELSSAQLSSAQLMGTPALILGAVPGGDVRAGARCPEVHRSGGQEVSGQHPDVPWRPSAGPTHLWMVRIPPRSISPID
jgi:hypothetical protein